MIYLNYNNKYYTCNNQGNIGDVKDELSDKLNIDYSNFMLKKNNLILDDSTLLENIEKNSFLDVLIKTRGGSTSTIKKKQSSGMFFCISSCWLCIFAIIVFLFVFEKSTQETTIEYHDAPSGGGTSSTKQ
jgi:hypothetical protein